MTPLPALDRRLPPIAVTLIGAVCGAVFMAGSAVAVTRDGSSRKPAPQAAPSASPTPTPTPSASPTPKPKPKPKPVPKPKKLADFIVALDEKLPEYIRVPDSAVGTGAVDLAKAARLGDGKASARDKRTLQNLGFVKGHSRAWEGDDSVVLLSLFEWKSADAAVRWVSLQRAVRQERGGAWQSKIPTTAAGCEKVDGEIVDSHITAVGRRTYSLAVIRDGSCKTHTEIAKVAKVFYDYAKQLPK